jgi:hypothetical protein
MPGHNGFRFDDYESISPARVCPTQRRPKEPVHATGSRLFSIEDSELLPESGGFQCKPVARYEQGTHVRDDLLVINIENVIRSTTGANRSICSAKSPNSSFQIQRVRKFTCYSFDDYREWSCAYGRLVASQP